MTLVSTAAKGGGLGAVTLSGTPSAGQFIRALSATTADWETVATGTTVVDYTQFTASVTIASTTEGTPTTIVSASAHSFDGSTLVCVEFFAPGSVCNPVAGSGFILDLYDGGTSLGRIAIVQNPSASSGINVPLFGRRFLTPSNASHTYSVGGWSFSSANPVVTAGAGGTTTALPGYIRITSGG